jgi:hypothetical protein
LILSVLIALCIPAGVAQAMPVANDRTQGSLIVRAAGGCWLGWHRNPNGGCSRDRYGLFGYGIDYVAPPYYYQPGATVYYQPGATVCGGRGVYKVCNIFGYCWWVCN